MLEGLFNPQSIAIIGASGKKTKVGHAILSNLITFGFKGRLYPVNPSASEILGLKCYKRVKDIPDDVDLAIVCIPAEHVPEALYECTEKPIKMAIVISAGFRETGKRGLLLEQKLKDLISRHDIRILGPNCLGVISTSISMNATFARVMPPAGRISFFSQSGALGVAVLDWAITNNIGLSRFVSLGNKTDIDETEIIQYLTDDSETDVILGYIEDVVDGKRFMETARRCSAVKPVVLLKAGGTAAGARAASSHTGALAGSDTAFEAAFKQTGIIRAGSIKELFDLAKVFSTDRVPSGNRIMIITNAGGPAILAADESERQGLTLPVPGAKTLKKLKEVLPSVASAYNPVDLVGDATAERYKDVLKILSETSDTDAFLIILTPHAMAEPVEVAERIVETAALSSKPVITAFMGGPAVKKAIDLLQSAGIPNYSYPEEAIRAYARAVRYMQWKKKTPGQLRRFNVKKEIVEKLLKKAELEGNAYLPEAYAIKCLQSYGFVFPAVAHASDAKTAARVAAEIGFPVVMKVSSADILHKTDVGGVKLGIQNQKEAEQSFYEIIARVKKTIPDARIDGVRIYEMISEGTEVIIGVTYDKTFGHMIMFGLGGIYVEVLKDITFRIVPVRDKDAREMISEIKSYPLLKGTRGQPPANTGLIVESILRLNQLVMDFPQIQEVDINPLVVGPDRVVALDARIILNQGG